MEQVIVGLLHDIFVLRLHLVCLHEIEVTITSDLIFLLFDSALRFLLCDVSVDFNLGCSDIAQKFGQVELQIVCFFAKLIIVASLELLLFKSASLAEKIDFTSDLLELHLVLGFHLDLVHQGIALRLL